VATSIKPQAEAATARATPKRRLEAKRVAVFMAKSSISS
jgi:hypothetical protein